MPHAVGTPEPPSSGSHEPERERESGHSGQSQELCGMRWKTSLGVHPLPFYLASFAGRDVDPQPF